MKEMSKSEDVEVGRAAGTVGFFTFLSRILGMVRDMVVAGFFGSGMAADAFFVAFRIPNLLRRLFAEGSLTIAFIPVFTEYLTKMGKKEAFDLARAVLFFLSLILVIVTLLGVLFSPWIVRVQAFGFGGVGLKYDLTVLLTRITFPYIFLISLVAFFMGVLNSLRHFAAPAAAPIFLNLGIIGSTFLISPLCSEPIVGVAVGVLIGGVFQVCLQIPWALKEGFKILPKWEPFHPALKRIGLLMIPAIFGSAVYQINDFIGTLLASFLVEGSVSWLYYANRLVQFPLGVFGIAISTAALPSLSSQVAEKDLEKFFMTLSHALRLVFFVTLPSMVGLIIIGKPLTSIIFERGAFDSYSTLMTNKALVCYAFGLWAFSGIRVLVSAFYALQDTMTPVKVASVSLVAYVLLSLALMGPLKHGGLALALSIASAIQFCILFILLKQKLKLGNFRPIFISIGKNCVASVAMGLSVYYIQALWLYSSTSAGTIRIIVNLTILIMIGIGVYFVTAWVLGSKELGSLKDMLHSKRKNAP